MIVNIENINFWLVLVLVLVLHKKIEEKEKKRRNRIMYFSGIKSQFLMKIYVYWFRSF